MEKHCVYLDYTIKEVIERFDENKDRVAVVLNQEQKVIGVVSQGDIIRALCGGKNLYTRVKSIIQPSFFFLHDRDMKEAYRVFKNKKITMLPIIDNDYYLVDIVTLDDIYVYLEEK